MQFRTRVITDGVVPSLHVDYKKTRIKQYHKELAHLAVEHPPYPRVWPSRCRSALPTQPDGLRKPRSSIRRS